MKLVGVGRPSGDAAESAAAVAPSAERSEDSSSDEGPLFGLLDDFALGLIIEAAARATPVAEWGPLCRVCRRWRRVAQSVLRRALRSLWPRFVVFPSAAAAADSASADSSSVLSHTDDAFGVRRCAGAASRYAWAFVAPLSVASVGAGIGVRFVPSDSAGVYVGVFLLSSEAEAALVGLATAATTSQQQLQLVWSPDSDAPSDNPRGATSCILGAYSGEIIVNKSDCCTDDDSHRRWRHDVASIGSLAHAPYDVGFAQDGTVSFAVRGRPFATHRLQDDNDVVEMLHDPSTRICFAIGLANNDITAHVELRPTR